MVAVFVNTFILCFLCYIVVVTYIAPDDTLELKERLFIILQKYDMKNLILWEVAYEIAWFIASPIVFMAFVYTKIKDFFQK